MTETGAEPPGGYLPLLRSGALRLALLSALLARLGGRIFALAIVLYALERFHSPALAGWLGFAATAPGMLVSPLAGALLDRVGAAAAMVIDMAASAMMAAAIAAAGYTLAGPAVLLMLTGLFSLTTPLGAAGIRALIPALVGRAALDRANALDSASYALVDISGPAATGVLFAVAGPEQTLLAVALCEGLAAVVLAPLAKQRRTVRGEPRPLLRQAMEGLILVLRHPTLRGLAISYALNMLCWGVLLVTVPVLVTSLPLSRPPAEAIGALWALSGAAGAVGALAAGAWRTAGRERDAFAIAALATAAALCLPILLPNLMGLAFALVLVGLLTGPIDVGTLTLRQRRAPPHQLGRVMAISMSLNMSGQPVGAAIGGILAGCSPATALLAAAAAAALSALAARALIPPN